MEPKLIKVDSKQNKILIIVSLLIITLFIGTSYSLLSSNDVLTKDNSEEAIVFKTGELNLELTGDNNLTLAEEYPKSDDEGKENKAIKLTFKNTGTIDICRYEVKLVSDDESTLDSKYLRYIVSENNEGDYKEAKNLDDTNIVYIGNKLKVDKSKTIYIKVWIDESAKDAGLSKTYSGSFEVDLYQGGCVEYGSDTIKNTLGKTGGVIGVTNDGKLATTKSNNIREYRYSGLNVNNYVTFNDETWRIIGVFEDEYGDEHLKIVKNEVLMSSEMPDIYQVNEISYKIRHSSSLKTAYWNLKSDGSYNNDWVHGGLKYWLNSEGTADGYLKKITNTAQNMIAATKWYLGNITYYDSNYNGGDSNHFGIKDTAGEAYTNERSSKSCLSSSTNGCQGGYIWPNNSATWIGKIALMYPSDFAYSADSKYWNTILGNGTFSGTPYNTSWLTTTDHTVHEWLLSPGSNTVNNATNWTQDGILNSNYVDGNREVRPTLYLKSDVKIIDGTGEENNHYILDF